MSRFQTFREVDQGELLWFPYENPTESRAICLHIGSHKQQHSETLFSCVIDIKQTSIMETEHVSYVMLRDISLGFVKSTLSPNCNWASNLIQSAHGDDNIKINAA